MTLGSIIKIGAGIAGQVFKHRKAIYTVLTAQDRYIDRAMKAGRYGLQARRGVRHGALAGSVIGSFITNTDDGLGNGIQKPVQPVNPSRPPHKARGGFSRRSNARHFNYNRPDRYGRCPRPRKYR